MAAVNKLEIYALCKENIEEKLAVISTALKNSQDAANNETKSSAGDKYETGRAMAHLENERLMRQKAELENLQSHLAKINPEISNDSAVLGSYIISDKAEFYLSVGLGQIKTGVYAIGKDSPVAKSLWSKTVGDTFVMGPNKVKVKEIY